MSDRSEIEESVSPTADASLSFRRVRLEALEVFRSVTWAEDGGPIACVWQQKHEPAHVAAYCNLLSHLEALEELLEGGTWCDDVSLSLAFDDGPDSEKLFRFLTTSFLLIDQCFVDCREILQAADGKDLQPASRAFAEFINRVWKHRGSRAKGKASPAFHSCGHHGPYFFEDDAISTPPPPDDCYLSLRHRPAGDCGAVTVVVPSLKAAINRIGEELSSISELLSEPAARGRVEAKWGSVELG